jgi:hypothetical protein
VPRPARMAQIPKLMTRLQFGLQFNTVPRRPGQTDQGRWSSLNRSGQRRPEQAAREAPYSTEVQQRPRTAASSDDRQHTQLAGTTAKRPAAPLVRDEAAAGSNPANPATKPQVTGYRVPAVRYTPLLMSVFGTKRERTGLLAGRIPASSWLSGAPQTLATARRVTCLPWRCIRKPHGVLSDHLHTFSIGSPRAPVGLRRSKGRGRPPSGGGRHEASWSDRGAHRPAACPEGR